MDAVTAALIKYIPLIIQYGGVVKGILDTATSNGDIVAKLQALARPLVSMLTDIGAKLFPQSAEAIHMVGGAIAAFDPNITRWIQGSVNNICKPTPLLEVDGIYGPLTRAGVETLQHQLGLDKIDGLAGQITQAAIAAFYAKQDQLQTAIAKG